jgi:hypothetical protein
MDLESQRQSSMLIIESDQKAMKKIESNFYLQE